MDKKQTVAILQSKATGEFIPASNAILGSVDNNIAEMLINIEGSGGFIGGSYEGMTGIGSIHWQKEGFEYMVLGNVPVDVLISFVKALSEGDVLIPAEDTETVKQPQIEVPVDLTAKENEQKSVDAGHSPWKLDPAFVTQVFASLLITQEGIVGDYPIPYEAVKMIKNNGTEAVAEISGDVTKARYVYLKRLVRQDETGIWSVVGYDPVNNQ